MSGVTIKILHGADRGKVFKDLQPPLTIGREEGNSIQLNDERVSRCHFKIQRDNDRLVLTDLDSTNGTKVNGSECQLKILRHGDLITVGRTMMLLGTEAQIAARMAAMTSSGSQEVQTMSVDLPHDSSILYEFNGVDSPRPGQGMLTISEPPSLPDRMSPGQAAQMCEILEYLQSRIHRLIEGAKVDEAEAKVQLPMEPWQQLLDVQARLGTLIRQVADPGA